VISHKIRNWNTLDRDFWVKYNIGLKLLKQYNVFPLEEYIMEKKEDENIHSMKISNHYIYGYFKKDGSLYKIYQPKNLRVKFVKIKSYTQGSEQLENHSKLLITSSLKDIMAIKSLNLKIDCIAPDSENTIISISEMNEYIKKYNGKVSVLFDNDKEGIKAMYKYKEIYNINSFLFTLSKDVSDGLKEYGVNKVLYTLIPPLQRCFE
jgi:hypothetical protein